MFFRAFDIMLNKVGGPVQSADDLYDEAVDGKKAEGPSEESIQQAAHMLGMELPPADGEHSGASGTTTATGDAAPDHASDTRPSPRFRRSYDAPPADEGSAGTGSDAPDSPDSPPA